MTFADPEILFFLWALVPAAWLLVRGVVRRKRILARFADPAMHPDLLPGYDPKSPWPARPWDSGGKRPRQKGWIS